MPDTQKPASSPVPEELWGGAFGDAYVERNAELDARRGRFWSALLARLDVLTALEVGCGQGGNLVHLAAALGADNVWGLDVNRAALDRAAKHVPGAHLVEGSARDLPFEDGTFDLVLTVGVLIHQPPNVLPSVIDEMVRASGHYVLCSEYHADETVELPYHGTTGTLFKRDYGRVFADRFPGIRELESGDLGVEDGFDRVRYHLFRRPGVSGPSADPR